MEYSNQITAVFFAILFSAASKSKWFYKKYVENSNDKKFANQVIKGLKICAYLLLGLTLLWLVDNIFSK
ncbi:MAG: hypothetical protein ACLPSL_16355 [Smithella sp.]